MIKILQFGDCHLDSGWDRLSPERAAAFRARSRKLITGALNAAAREKADLVLCTGDLFDTPHPYPDTVEYCAAAFAACGRPVFISPGNHDPYGRSSPYTSVRWSDNVHVFTSPLPERAALPFCGVTGIAYTSKNPGSRPLLGYRAPDSGLPELLLVHGHAGMTDGGYMNIPYEDISAAGFAYAGVGHVHKPEISSAGSCLVVRNGSIEGRGFDETGERGCYITELGGKSEARFIPLPGARALSLELAAGKKTAPELAAEALASCPWAPEDTQLRLALTGKAPPDLRALAEGLSAFAALDLDDRTAPPRDVWKRENEDSLTGLFLREIKKLGDTPQARLALRYGMAALEGREEPRDEI